MFNSISVRNFYFRIFGNIILEKDGNCLTETYAFLIPVETVGRNCAAHMLMETFKNYEKKSWLKDHISLTSTLNSSFCYSSK